MSQSDFNEILLPKPEYPEAWNAAAASAEITVFMRDLSA